jgi:hypothetical protein
VLNIPYLLSIHNFLNVPPQEKKSSGERSGLRGGQGIGSPFPIQASGNLSFDFKVNFKIINLKIYYGTSKTINFPEYFKTPNV